MLLVGPLRKRSTVAPSSSPAAAGVAFAMARLIALALATAAALVRPADAQTVPTAAASSQSWRDPGTLVRQVVRDADTSGIAEAGKRWRARVGNDRSLRPLLEGTLARVDFKFVDAERWYARIARDDSSSRAAAHAAFGAVAVTSGSLGYLKAQAAVQAIGRRLLQLGDSSGYAEVLLAQASLTLRGIGFDSARAVLRASERATPASDAWLRARQSCTALQLRARAREKLRDSTWHRARAEASAQGPRVYAECLFVQAQYLESLGIADSVYPVLDTLAAVQRATGLRSGLAATLQWRGSIYMWGGHYRAAREVLHESLRIAATLETPGADSWATLNLGQIAYRTGNWGEASRLLLRARTSFLAANDRLGLAYADRTYAESALRRGDLARADSAFIALVATSDAVSLAVRVSATLARAEIARQQHRLELSAHLLDSAAALARQRNMNEADNEQLYTRALLAMSRGDYAAARAGWQQLLEPARQFDGPSRFEVLTRAAETDAAAGDLNAAWRDFQQAQRVIDGWRGTRALREDQLSALQDRHFDWDIDLGLATTVARFATSDRTAEAMAIAEWRRLRSMEQQALQRGAFAIERADQSGIVVRSLSADTLDIRRLPTLARARLGPSLGVISYIVGQGGEPTTAFLLTRDTLLSVQLAPIDSLVARLDRFNGFLQAGQLSASLSRALSEALLDPLLRRLPSTVTRLVVVPDGALHRLPFAALSLPDGTSLLTRTEISIAPSVEDALGGAVLVSRRAAGSANNGKAPRAVIVGAPNVMPMMPGATTPWVALPGAHAEARAVARMLDGSVLLDGDAVTRDGFSRRLRDGGALLHVATHAVADAESYDGSGIVVQSTGSQSVSQAGLFSGSELAAQPLAFDLVVLSACASSNGLLVSGQALHGLVSTALDAGARGVVATRWRLDDAAVVPLMDAFYRRLLNGDDAIAALHAVRRDAQRRGLSPALWANLEYFGDPTLRVTLRPRAPGLWARWTTAIGRWLGGAE